MRWMPKREEGLIGADNIDKLDKIEGNVDNLHNDDVTLYVVTFASLCYIMTLK